MASLDLLAPPGAETAHVCPPLDTSPFTFQKPAGLRLASMTTRVPLNSLRYRPLPPKRGKFSYLLYGVWGFSIIEGDEELTAVPDGALAYTLHEGSYHKK